MVRVRVTGSGGPATGGHRGPLHSSSASGIRGLHAHNQSGHGQVNRGIIGANQQPGHGVKGGFEGPMNAPWRKTVSIFKQPVTLVRTTSRETRPAPNSELQAAAKAGTGKQEKPKQVFWAKRLEGLCAVAPVSVAELKESEQKLTETKDEETETSQANESIIADTPREVLSLPSRINPVGPEIGECVAAASLMSALQTGGSTSHQPPITGQTNPKKHLDSNPGVYTNPDQPMIHAVVVSDQDVTSQEGRVLDARRRLEEARKHFG